MDLTETVVLQPVRAGHQLLRFPWFLNGGVFPICPEMSRFVPVLGLKKDKRGQTGAKRDISGQIGKRPHSGSPI